MLTKLRRHIIGLLSAAAVLGVFAPVEAQPKPRKNRIPEHNGLHEVYNHKFLQHDDNWTGMSVMQRYSEAWRIKADWKANTADSLRSGLCFSMPNAQEGDFLFVYKLFGGLQPGSMYKLSFLSSFTLQEGTVQNNVSGADLPGSVHLKIGANDLRPKTLYNRGNFSKGSGPVSGRNLQYLGDLKWMPNDSTHRYIQQNYDEPVYAVTNNQGNLYVIMGIEKSAEKGPVPDIYLNTLRITFDYVGKDSLEMKRPFRVETTETEEKNVYSYEVHPIQEVVRYSIFTKDGHLIMVEDDTDCVPSCPNTIDASFLEPDQYWVEFILLNEKRIVQPLIVKP